MSIKLNIIGRRRPGTTLDEHRHHIRWVHGERVREYVRVHPDLAPRRYVQNVVVDSTFRPSIGMDDPLALNRDFVTQIWMPDLETLQRSRQSDFYNEWLRDDEPQFVDQANVVFLPCFERGIHGADETPQGAWKLFVMMRCTPAGSIDAFDTAWQGAARQAGSLGLRHVQNLVMATASAASPVNAIDELWFASEDDARAHLVEWRRRLNEALVPAGLADPFSFVALIAREDVVHAGSA